VGLPALTGAGARTYERHKPEDTVRYRIVAEHLETFLAEAREKHERGLPDYVEKELREYLKCGILAHGFLRARCRSCGKNMLVALSCKKRGVCPSCNARRMSGTAAHLTLHVIPDIPVRQWVLSVPFELRLLLARDPRALTAVGRIFVQEIFRWQRESAGIAGLRRVRGGAICFPQRFGGSLNLNVHYHVAVPDGVFTLAKGSDRADFHRLPKPDHADLETLAFNTEMRVTAWLRRHGLLRDEDVDAADGTASRSALDACLEGSLGLGELTALPAKHPPLLGADDMALPVPSRSDRRGGHSRGFDVHAGVVVSASDREGRERLLRYCARPPLSLERLSVLRDGRIAYAIRKPWTSETHRVMQPVQFLARLAALISPPRHPLIRFHGVFAPHSSWRKKVVPPSSRCDRESSVACRSAPSASSPIATTTSLSDTACSRGSPPCTITTGRPCTQAGPAFAAPVGPVHAAPFTLRAPSARIDWAELLKRIYDVDALACPCGGRLRFIALILDEEPAREILDSLGLPSRAPPVARARVPDWVDPLPTYE
jgi:hypothetical protein